MSGAVIIKHLGDLSDKRKADRRKRVLRLGPYPWFRLQPFRFLLRSKETEVSFIPSLVFERFAIQTEL